MYIGRAFLFGIVLYVLVIGITPTEVSAGNETEILNITVGEPTKLSSLEYANSAVLAVSRTGVVAAFYPDPNRKKIPVWRVSKDGGETWSKEVPTPRGVEGGCPGSVGLRDGGVIIVIGASMRLRGGSRDDGLPLAAPIIRFPDDFSRYEMDVVPMYIPNVKLTWAEVPPGINYTGPSGYGLVQLPNGDILCVMSGQFTGDTGRPRRVLITKSSDQGRTWYYHASVAYKPENPNPDLPGQYLGYAEPTIEMMKNGQMICVMRTQYSHLPGEYLPLHVSWSDDLGKTWTKPVETNPHLMNIHPTLVVLDNGVVACIYGRPGFSVAFSLDNGHTWQDRVSFSHLPEPVITGQVHGVTVGPNKLMAIGSIAGEGTQIFPVTVERIKVSPAHAKLKGSVIDQQGNPIADAKVERSPNRYTADDWLEHPTKLGPWESTPLTVGVPRLGYRSTQEQYGYPTVQTDAQGRFHFESVKLGEYVLTVEGDGYAPQHKHVKVGPESKPQDFQLKAGRKICNRVVDDTGGAVPGACVVLNLWHVHTDLEGFFHWSVEDPAPQQVAMKVYKRYSNQYEELETTVALSQLESQPITLKNR